MKPIEEQLREAIKDLLEYPMDEDVHEEAKALLAQPGDAAVHHDKVTPGMLPKDDVARSLMHGMNCPASALGNDDECLCGLKWRVALATEQTMHNAWRKRAEQAERELADAVAAERERCAKLVETQTVGGNKAPGSASRVLLAAAIRGVCKTCLGEGSIGQADEGTLAACPDCAIRATGTPEPPVGGTIGLDAKDEAGTRKCCNVCDGELPCKEHSEPPSPAPSPTAPVNDYYRMLAEDAAINNIEDVAKILDKKRKVEAAPSPEQEDVWHRQLCTGEGCTECKRIAALREGAK